MVSGLELIIFNLIGAIARWPMLMFVCWEILIRVQILFDASLGIAAEDVVTQLTLGAITSASIDPRPLGVMWIN